MMSSDYTFFSTKRMNYITLLLINLSEPGNYYNQIPNFSLLS